MSTSLTLDTAQRSGGILILIAGGEIDLSNIEAFKEALSTAVSQAASSGASLVVDLSAVEYLDSAAINVLCAQAEVITDLIANPLLMSTFTISGLAELVAVAPASPTSGA
ncbi:STAS domain-containing protein [Mycolicibacterium mengxianglii]|uniref:STAS domain-containing protein n=1 Tax=Mycolicibacterium mengxianglii TaxID=2736649 RepID=UPI0018D1BFA7|nr:STAS domain-containing protein [Mycolicibacterium mengxianglii]